MQNTYVVHAKGTNECLIIDAGMYTPDEQQAVAEYIRRKRYRITGLTLEHKAPPFDLRADVFNNQIVFEGRNSSHNAVNIITGDGPGTSCKESHRPKPYK